MKIGVVTVIDKTNFGAILQAYALQMELKKMGHEVFLIVRPELYGRVKQKNYKNYLRKARSTKSFIDKHISQIKVKSLYHLNTSDFDAIIVGSDQVWRRELEGKAIENIKNMFLDFVPKDSKCKKIAYAASFGVSYWNFSPKRTAQFASLSKHFDAISVREDSGVKLCRDYLGVNASHVLDPTMLLTPNDYIQYLHIADVPPNRGQFLVYFVWPVTKDKKVAIKSIKRRKNYTMEVIEKEMENRMVFSVKRWLRAFHDAEFVLTDSFHGCAFSIIFNKPFIAYGHKLGGIARLTSLLKMCGLESRLIFTYNELTEKQLEASIDWEVVNRKLQKLRNLSEDFLVKALKSINDKRKVEIK